MNLQDETVKYPNIIAYKELNAQQYCLQRASVQAWLASMQFLQL
jgi:hypothetical protein